jgi:hypothetical protein
LAPKNIKLTQELSKQIAASAKTSPVLLEKLSSARAIFEKKSLKLSEVRKSLDKS